MEQTPFLIHYLIHFVVFKTWVHVVVLLENECILKNHAYDIITTWNFGGIVISSDIDIGRI